MNNISITCLQSLLNEVNFYPQIAFTLTSFFPYETYSLSEFKLQNQSNQMHKEEANSICSPMLVSSICQLLFNLTVLLPEEALLMATNSGILNLLISYVKPVNLLSKDNSYAVNERDWRMNEEIVDMLYMICRYFNICCDIDPNFISILLKNNSQNNLVYEIIECLSINALNKGKKSIFPKENNF